MMPATYTIVVESQLDDHWSTWFERLTITHDEKGNTVLQGTMVDQAALYGILMRLRDLGLTLISVNRLNP